MAVFGNTILNQSKITESEISFDNDEICLAEYFIINNEILNEGYKYLHKVDTYDLSKDGSYLASIWKKEIENMQAQGCKEKMISKYMYTMYYAIVGQCFGVDVPKIRNNTNVNYVPKFAQYWNLANKYLNDKDKAKILKDIQNTIPAAKNFMDKNNSPENKVLIAYYNAYLNDLKNIK